jgi:phospholipid/cholesterol/gamma-HCH transport system substrate-binding protein
MDKEKKHTVQLGIFVFIGIILLIIAIYFIGEKKNMFSSNFPVKAVFREVNGLQGGNNVRFRGIDIGTVKSIEVLTDSSVLITMILEEKIKPFIKSNAIASITTDGLMGNKMIIIKNGEPILTTINENDTLKTTQPIDTDQIMKKLSASNENVRDITNDLKQTVKKINDSKSLWALLSDSVTANNLREAIVKIKVTGNNASQLTGSLTTIIQRVKDGKGSIGALLSDTTLSYQLKQSVSDLKLTTGKATSITSDLSNITSKINRGEGAMGTILMDTAFANSLNQSMKNIKSGTDNFDQDMEALKHNFLLKRYFKDKKNEK